MRFEGPEFLFVVGMATGAILVTMHACGGSQPPPAAPAHAEQVAPTSEIGADQSRCQFEGRSDREVANTSGPGATEPNIRRVYVIVGEGENRHRVLSCREIDTNLDRVYDVVRTYDDQGESAHESVDSDYDGRYDTWHTFSNGRIAKTQIDSNGDGKPDQTRYYIRGKLSRVQRDTNHDGEPDVREVYEDGRLLRMGEDLDFDGHVDRWNRDESVSRLADRAEEEGESSDQPMDGGVTDARVSARNR